LKPGAEGAQTKQMNKRTYIKMVSPCPSAPARQQLIERLSRHMANHYSIAVITNDITPKKTPSFSPKTGLLPAERIIGVEPRLPAHRHPRRCQHELEAVEEMSGRFPNLDIIFIESGGDNLSATSAPSWRPSPSLSSTWPRR